MSYIEKIDVYVPESLSNLLINDAKLFEIYKKDEQTINRNKFLNMILVGYHSQFVQDNKRLYDDVYGSISGLGINLDILHMTTKKIVENMVSPPIRKKKGVKLKRLSLKPTQNTAYLIMQARNGNDNEDGISKLFRKMLISYSEKPLPEREQIVFRDNYELLQRACKKQQLITFSTIWNTSVMHKVLPYEVVVGKEEMFNYLICEEYDDYASKYVARSYRLSRLTNIGSVDEVRKIDDNVKRHLEQMKNSEPQYAINNDETICIKLSKSGERLYKRMYFGRPTPTEIVEAEDGKLYYFNCSEDQVFFYFRRFDKDNAIIIEPQEFKEKMIDFHRSVLESYESHAGNKWLTQQ